MVPEVRRKKDMSALRGRIAPKCVVKWCESAITCQERSSGRGKALKEAVMFVDAVAQNEKRFAHFVYSFQYAACILHGTLSLLLLYHPILPAN